MIDVIEMAKEAKLKEDVLAKKGQSKLYMFYRNVVRILKMPGENTSSLFIFSEENIIRKYSRLMIEWGYPFFLLLLLVLCVLIFSIYYNQLIFLIHCYCYLTF